MSQWGTLYVTLNARAYPTLVYGMLGGGPVLEPEITPELAAWEDDGGAYQSEWVHTFTVAS